MDGWHITVGIRRKRREASCQNHSLSLFVIRPRAAGKCFSEHTLVLSLRKPDLEVTSRSNCTSVGIQILKGVKEMSGSLCLGSWVDPIQASHGPKKLSGCLGNVELIWTMHSRWVACLLWIQGQLELPGGLPRKPPRGLRAAVQMGGTRLRSTVASSELEGRASSFVLSIWISFFNLLKTLTLLCYM